MNMKTNCPTEDQIRIRAYELYFAHGGQPGHELDDWLQAERELTAEAAADAAKPKPAQPPKK